MPDSTTGPDLPIWPGGIARLRDGVLEITTGDGIRVAVDDIVEIAGKPPRAGRFSLTLGYRAGLDRARTSYWIEPEHRLVAAVRTKRDAA